jgi:hypothetical protein
MPDNTRTVKQADTPKQARRHSRARPPVPQPSPVLDQSQNLQHLYQRGMVRPKLRVGPLNDMFEQDADRVADRVVQRMPAPGASMPADDTEMNAPSAGSGRCACGAVAGKDGRCDRCRREARQVRRKIGGTQTDAGAQSDVASRSAPPSVMTSLASSQGRPLEERTRRTMEQAFGASFGGVRVHTGYASNRAARDIRAKAFTHGQDIHFAEGQYRPGTHSGRKLLAHELAHTLQQADRSANGAVHTLRRQADAGPPDAGPSDAGPVDAGGAGPTRRYKGETLSTDPVYTYELLKRIYLAHGYDKMEGFVNSFRLDEVLPYRPRAGVSDDPVLNQNEAYLAALEKQLAVLTKERVDFVAKFEDEAKSVARDFLDENEKHVKEEAIRYGLRDLRLDLSWSGFSIVGDVADNASTRGLAIAAQGILERKKKARAAAYEYGRFARAMGSPSPAAARQRTGLQSHEVSIHLATLHGEVRQTQRDLGVYRIQVQTKFPLLAALSRDEDFQQSELEDLARGTKGSDAAATKVIVDQIVEKLVNIHKVRQELKPGGDVNIWLVPKLVEPTREHLKAKPGTLYGKMVDEKITDEKPSWITGILIGLLQLVLVLLAPVTEGLTLIPAAAIGAGTAYSHFKEYQIKKAMHGTDFGAAALSAEDPSLFWLAVDIIGAGFDVAAGAGAAFRMFRQLAPAARAARAAQASEEAVLTLEREARALGGDDLARRVVSSARNAQRGGGRQAGMSLEEARKFEQAAAEVAARELGEGAQSAVTLAGGKVTVSRSGGIFSCSSPCTMLRERYKDMLVREPKYLKRVNDLEARARNLPSGPQGDVARRAIADEAAILEREMRTTALPGDWTSPLKGASDFDELVKRRGSIAPQLDHHPPGWTGADEARFRFGRNIDPEPGYRWTLDENGILRYDRMDRTLPLRRYNAASGLFEDAAEEAIKRAVFLPGGETRALANLPKKERAAMEAAFKKRGALISERDRLEALQQAGALKPKDAERLKKLAAQINEQSRQLGENAAEGVMRSQGGKKLYPLTKTHSTSGDFDQVWKVGDEFHIIEAKGGSGGLGSRTVAGGARAEQGTREYALAIAQNMAINGATKEIRQMGRDLIAAIGAGKVKYVLVQAPVGTKAGAAVLSDVKVKQFDISQ